MTSEKPRRTSLLSLRVNFRLPLCDPDSYRDNDQYISAKHHRSLSLSKRAIPLSSRHPDSYRYNDQYISAKHHRSLSLSKLAIPLSSRHPDSYRYNDQYISAKHHRSLSARPNGSFRAESRSALSKKLIALNTQ
jgi:hypothetical protein